MKDSFIVYRSFYLAISELKDKDRLMLYDAIFEFGLNHKELDLNKLPKAMFCLIKPQLEANHRKYLNGKLGGRGNKANLKQNESKQEPKDKQEITTGYKSNNLRLTKAEPNVNVNVNDNNKVNVNVSLPLKEIGQEVILDYNFITELKECYPLVDLNEELLKMRVWLLANPSKRKTNKGMPRFVNSWLNKVKVEAPTDSYANIHKAVMDKTNVRKQ